MTDQNGIKEVLRGNVGCSDIGAILGVDQYRSACDVYDRLMGFTEVEPTPQMERGHVMEDVIAKKYAQDTGRYVMTYDKMLRDREMPWLVGHIDRRVLNGSGKDGVLEIKSRNSHALRKIKREGLDQSTWLQIQGYISLTGWAYGAFTTVDYDTWSLLHFDIEPDTEAIVMIRSKVKNFWENNILKNRRPEVFLEPVELNLPAVGGEVTAIDDPDWSAAVADLREAKALADDAKMIEAAAKEKIIGLMGGADVAEGSGLRVYYREQAGRKSFDVKAFSRDNPGVDLEKYYKQGSPFRVFKPYFI